MESEGVGTTLRCLGLVQETMLSRLKHPVVARGSQVPLETELYNNCSCIIAVVSVTVIFSIHSIFT